MTLAGETEAANAGMRLRRGKLGGLSETLNGGARTAFLRCATNLHRIGRPQCLENPRRKGGILTNGERPLSVSS
jgi:hypothetical protein